MEYKEGKIGRIFTVKFDHGEDIFVELEKLVRSKKIGFATLLLLGAIKDASFVMGPKDNVLPAEPVWELNSEPVEIIAFGNIVYSDKEIHMHIHSSAGSKMKNLTGCLRKNAEVFITVEAVITEVDGISVNRKIDKVSGCKTLNYTN